MSTLNPKPYPAGTKIKSIITPHDHDVLSGRGNYVNYHVGNEHFRSLVKKHKIAYVACPKPEKGRFSTIIVDEVRSLDPPGRFLKQDATTKLWQDIGDKKSLDKTRQALREGAPELLKELVEDDPKVGVLFITFCCVVVSYQCFIFLFLPKRNALTYVYHVLLLPSNKCPTPSSEWYRR